MEPELLKSWMIVLVKLSFRSELINICKFKFFLFKSGVLLPEAKIVSKIFSNAFTVSKKQ